MTSALVPVPECPETDSTDDDIAVADQLEIKVFLGGRGDVVIQQSDWPNDDTVILVRPENAAKLALRLLKVAGFGDLELIRNVGGGYEDFDPNEPPSPASSGGC